MSKKTEERPLDSLKERLLLAIHEGIVTTGGLKASLKIDTRKFYTEIGNLEKDKYAESSGYATWRLLPLGKTYVTTYLDVALGQPFEDKEIQDFIEKFPEPYLGILRLSLSCCVAKRTKIFDEPGFGAGFPSVLLIGEAGIGKSPTGHTLAWLQGKDPEDVTIDAGLLTKGELGGRLEWYGKKGHRKRGLALSYWQKQDYAQIEDVDKALSKDVSGVIRVIAFAERSFIREGKRYPNLVMPFMTMNVEGKKGQAALDKITDKMDVPFLKRNCVLFCNPSKGVLGKDPWLFFRETVIPGKIPKIDLDIPVKTKLNISEAELISKLVKRAMLPGLDASHCDKRGLEIMSLAYSGLTGDKDVVGAIYQIVKDRLQCLESLGLVCEAWRDWYNKEWLEYAGKDPKKAEEIRRAIERQKGLEATIIPVDIPKGIHNGKVSLAKRHNTMLDKLRKMRDALGFPLTGIAGVRLPDYKKKELCSRYEANHEGLRDNIKIEIKILDSVTKDNARIGERVALAFWKEVQSIGIAFKNDLQASRNDWLKGLDDVGLKQDVVRGIETLIRDLWEADLWATTTSVFIRSAIKNLREKSGKLRSHLQTVLKHKKDSSLNKLQWELKNAEVKSQSWFEDFEEDCKDLGIEMATEVAGGVYNVGERIAGFFKGRGGGKGGKQPPTKSRSPNGEGGRNIDDL